MVFLDFEKSIEDLYTELNKLQEIQAKGKTDVSKPIEDLEKEIKKERKALYSNLSAWQKVQVSRHPERPYTLSYIEAVTKGNFIEMTFSMLPNNLEQFHKILDFDDNVLRSLILRNTNVAIK